ncbi:glycosyltransferase [Flavobacterium sp. KACC 22758]|jgi:glycosyltransferase involved in cell wall biosynthesis|uniref:glycosyltransferase n=1 Tax=Flavobacterium sp. KACC 22758 TaxID=3025667 RepID=UPI0023665B90|nr:glycosyltransferase [Flavobacterium sp. KACC 22758]WDF59096.1 glycosyltransferase [Flavobacterium sp. KACC 22758]
MISIVVCSKDLQLYNNLQKSLEETIGKVKYEIIRINNLKENLSIAKAYNLGIRQSNYEYLLFIHEDILFHSINWGKTVINIFENNLNIGLLGVAGTKYKSKFPSAFWHTREDLLSFNVIQHYPHKEPRHIKIGFSNSNLENVVAIDGVFMMLKKNTGIQFNEEIEGFHCYDMSISLDVLIKGYEIVVTDQILIEHFSSGKANVDFIKGIVEFHKLYKNKLPNWVDKKDLLLESLALKKFLELCLYNRYVPLKFWLFNFLYNPLDKLNFNILKFKVYQIKNKLKINAKSFNNNSKL